MRDVLMWAVVGAIAYLIWWDYNDTAGKGRH
jgi:hypothetical protein